MRKLTFGMNLSLDGYIAAPGDDLGWSVPSDELFQWWSDRMGATGLRPQARGSGCGPRQRSFESTQRHSSLALRSFR